MAANVVVAPVAKFGTAVLAGATIDFTNWYGAVTVQNLGTVDVWIKFDVDGSAMVAADTNGQIRLLANGGAISFNVIQFSKIGIIAAGVGSAVVQAVASASAQSGRR